MSGLEPALDVLGEGERRPMPGSSGLDHRRSHVREELVNLLRRPPWIAAPDRPEKCESRSQIVMLLVLADGPASVSQPQPSK